MLIGRYRVTGTVLEPDAARDAVEPRRSVRAHLGLDRLVARDRASHGFELERAGLRAADHDQEPHVLVAVEAGDGVEVFDGDPGREPCLAQPAFDVLLADDECRLSPNLE